MPHSDSTSGPSPPDDGPTHSFQPTRTDPLSGNGQPAPDGSPASADGPPPRFQPIAFHKEGGMGWVHRALDAELNREVAFKEIKPEFADHPIARRRFLFEAEITGRLEHPGIVPVYGLGRDPFGRPYYAMRFIDGLSLRDAVKAFHELPDPAGTERVVALRRLLAHFVTVCQTIAYAHSRGVIHRDLKPANIMLGPFGETLVVDWGVARRMRAEAGEPESVATDTSAPGADSGSAPTWSAKGTKVGTPGYWSPEQAAGRPDLHDERTDVYGLGAVLFEILTGSPPHPTGDHPPTPPSPRAVRSWVDGVLDGIVQRALCLAQDDRFPSAVALAGEVEQWLADQPVAAQRAAVAALEQRAAEHLDDNVLAEQLARQRANLGLMYGGMGRDAEAVAELTAAAGMFAALASARAKPRLLADEANCHLAIARCLDVMGRKGDAAAVRKKAAEIYQRLIATRPDEYKANYATLMLTHVDLPPAPAPMVPPEEQTVDALPPPDTTARDSSPPDSAPPTPPPDDSDGMKTLPAPDSPSRTPDPSTDLDEGYTPIRELGRGALGSVFIALDKALERTVAIKVLRETATHAPAYRARFLRELRIAASLEHPNIVRVYTYGVRRSGQPFMVMEYLDGPDLFHLVRTSGGGWTAAFLEPVAQACDGIHYAHEKGIIHRDPKPANIIVLPSGRAVVFDWGLAKAVGRPDGGTEPGVGTSGVGELTETHEGAVMGTPAYMSPEQARGTVEEVGPASDIYGLGATLFHVLTGQPPLRTERGLHDLLSQLRDGRVPRPRDVRPDVPPAIDAICARAMSFRAKDRYPSAAALAADIRSFLAGQPVSESPRRSFWGWLTGR